MVLMKYVLTVSFITVLSQFESNSLNSLKEYLGNLVFCYDSFLPISISDSLNSIKYNVYGQPFVENNLIPSIEKHFEIDIKKNVWPKKPFVLMMSGPVGVGKTFVGEMLHSSNFFRNKKLFPLSSLVTSSSLEQLKMDILEAIVNSVFSCKRSIFIFDDVNAVPSDFFEDLPPFDFTKCHNLSWPYSLIDVSFFRESLFVFISQNDGGTITKVTENFLKEGLNRDSIGLEQFIQSMYKTDPGFIDSGPNIGLNYFSNQSSALNFIYLYIPFLPLDPTHVKDCIKKEVLEIYRNWNENFLRDVLISIHCNPDDTFCSSGCKLVNAKVPITLSRHDEL